MQNVCPQVANYMRDPRDNADGNSQLLDNSDFYQQLLKEFFVTIDPMSSDFPTFRFFRCEFNWVFGSLCNCQCFPIGSSLWLYRAANT
nr:protein AATF-like isoform X1 [Ipomoea batatas]